MPPLRPFSDWITDHARGTVNDDLTAALAQVAEAVSHQGAAGEVTLKVRVEPAGPGGRTVATRCTVTAKPPTPAPEVSIFYVGPSGELIRDDPYNRPLPLEEDEHTARLPYKDGD